MQQTTNANINQLSSITNKYSFIFSLIFNEMVFNLVTFDLLTVDVFTNIHFQLVCIH